MKFCPVRGNIGIAGDLKLSLYTKDTGEDKAQLIS